MLYISPSTQRWQSPYLLLAWDRIQALYIAIETQETDSSTYYDLLRNIMKYKVTTGTCHCDVICRPLFTSSSLIAKPYECISTGALVSCVFLVWWSQGF
jgi:hypothetical protein